MSRRYEIAPTAGIETIRNNLAQVLHCEREPKHRFRCRLLDTLDWRLYQKGFQLSAESHDGGNLLRLHKIDNHELVSHAHCQQLPTRIETLPAGKLKDLLDPILEVRALLEQITLDITRCGLSVLNKQQKTIARFGIESSRMLHPGAVSRPFKNLFFTPLRGYAKEAGKIVRALDDQASLTRADGCPLERFLDEASIDTQQFSNKLKIKLDPAQRSDAAVKQILLPMLSTMRLNRQPVIDDIDSECLHDFRVAVRRSRAALKQLPQVFPKRELDRYYNQLSKLGALTTPLRDLDVMLRDFDRYRQLLPAEQRPHLEPLLEFLVREREAQWRRVSRHLASPSHEKFINSWSTFLARPCASKSELKNTTRPIGELAAGRIRTLYKKIIRHGKRIDAESPAEYLHQLRKECKKLRYLIEFSQSLHSAKTMKKIIGIMKGLQDILGEYQDLQVHIGMFADLERKIEEKKKLSADTAQAIQAIIRQLDQRQQFCREHFKGKFDTFASEPHRATFAELFGP